MHNVTDSRTVLRLSGFVSGTILSKVSAVHVVRKGNANILHGGIRTRLERRGGVDAFHLNAFNRNRGNMAVTRLGGWVRCGFGVPGNFSFPFNVFD